jgi:hypothetical protein
MCFFLSVVLRPVECLFREMRSTFLWDGAYSSGVSRKEKEITNSALSASRTTLSVVEGEWVVNTHK